MYETKRRHIITRNPVGIQTVCPIQTVALALIVPNHNTIHSKISPPNSQSLFSQNKCRVIVPGLYPDPSNRAKCHSRLHPARRFCPIGKFWIKRSNYFLVQSCGSPSIFLHPKNLFDACMSLILNCHNQRVFPVILFPAVSSTLC